MKLSESLSYPSYILVVECQLIISPLISVQAYRLLDTANIMFIVCGATFCNLLLDIRAFDDNTKREVYERQNAQNIFLHPPVPRLSKKIR